MARGKRQIVFLAIQAALEYPQNPDSQWAQANLVARLDREVQERLDGHLDQDFRLDLEDFFIGIIFKTTL